MDPTQLPDDVETLKALLRQALERNEQLQEQIRMLLAKRFGPSSEKHAPEQMGLFNEAEADAGAQPVEAPADETLTVPGHERAKPGRRPLPESLPRVEVVHDLPEAEKVCPHDGTALVRIGEETSEHLEIIPAKVQVIRHVRLKYACPCCDAHVARAPAPPQLLPKSNAGPGLLAYVCTSKYVDALPLARQEKMLARIGVELPRATLAQWMMKLGEAVLPLINLMREQMLAYDLIQMDETTVQVLKEPGRAPSATSYFWVQRGGPPHQPILLFDYDPSRGQGVPLRLLEGFAGYLQVDGYDGYNAVGKRDGITLVGCWAHARRKFDEAVKAQGAKAKPGRATKGLNLIQRLYRVETLARDMGASARRALREEQARPVLEEIRRWVDDSLPHVPPQSAVGKALGYLDSQWHKLIGYLKDGRIAIDNNAAERAIRPFVIGRNNWLFSDTPKGASASARLYSLIETAKANGHEPWAYLNHLFKELPTATTAEQLEALLPYNLSIEITAGG